MASSVAGTQELFMIHNYVRSTMPLIKACSGYKVHPELTHQQVKG